MRHDLKLVYAIALVLLVVMQAIATTGLISGPIEIFVNRLRGDIRAANLTLLVVHFLILQLCSRPSRRELAWVLGVGVAGIPLFLLSVTVPFSQLPTWVLAVAAAPGFGLAALAALALRLRDPARDAGQTRVLLWACGLAPLTMAVPYSCLELTAALHPATLDLSLYRFEGTLGFDSAATLAMVFAALPPVKWVAAAAYMVLPYTIGAMFAFQVARRMDTPASVLLVPWLGSVAAFAIFHVVPAAGPAYLFGAQFPYLLPAVPDAASASFVIASAPRNAMPSMHFGWAVALWLSAIWTGHRGLRAATAVLLGLNVIATLGLGEHYLVDLVVATPLMVALQAAGTRTLDWRQPVKRRAVFWGAGMTLAWLLALRFALEAFLALPGLSWFAVLLTIAASVALFLPLQRAALTSYMPPVPARPVLRAAPSGTAGLRIAGLFVVSGFAGLVYQVLFSKALALTFGSMSTATYTVLATYMAGMALGAWLGGMFGARRAEPLVLYAFCELGIGLYCLATPWLIPAIRGIYVSLASDIPAQAAALVALRFGLGAMALLVPTVLMGMTLPILARHFEQHRETLGKSVAWLYGANTVGAALGALLAGYAILPALGMTGATLTAVAANMLAAYLALRLAKSAAVRVAAQAGTRHAGVQAGPPERRLARAALAILGVGGAVTLALEVNYIHLLAVVAGNSVYAFALMLFAFLIGLGGGAGAGRRLLASNRSPGALLAWLELGLAAAILFGIPAWEAMPRYFETFAGYPAGQGFAEREMIRGIVCALAMVPPALFIGAAYPIAIEAVGRAAPDSPIAALGRAAALNTAGNIAGVVLGGFFLLPKLGALLSLKVLAALCLFLALLAHFATGQKRRAWPLAGAAAVLALYVWTPWTFDNTILASGANVYFAPQNYGRVIDFAESVDGGLTTVAETGEGEIRTRTLLTNGKFQGSDSLRGEMKAQVGFSVAPLLHQGARESALVIGYGTGMSARVLHDAGFLHMDIVDLSADVVRLANRHFSGLNDRVSEAPDVHTHITDGRNFLMLQRGRYDLVAMEISSIWFAGAATLYNREFYELVRARLAPHGVLQQWLQLHRMREIDLLYVLGSVRSTFRYVWLYFIGGQGIIVASNDAAAEPGAAKVARLDGTPALARHLALYGGSAAALVEALLLDPEGVERLLGSRGVARELLVSTDDNLLLEYGTPKGNVLDAARSLEANLAFLRAFAGRGPLPAR